MRPTKIRVTQVTFTPTGVVVAGEPLDDPTKVVIAAAEPVGAVPLAIAVATGITDLEVDPPDEAIVEILEKP